MFIKEQHCCKQIFKNCIKNLWYGYCPLQKVPKEVTNVGWKGLHDKNNKNFKNKMILLSCEKLAGM